MSLPEGVREGYISHIDAILAESDLATISVNNVRQKLQERVEDDITAQKAAIKDLIKKRFDAQLVAAVQSTEPEATLASHTRDHLAPATNGQHGSSDAGSDRSPQKRIVEEDGLSDVVDESPLKRIVEEDGLSDVVDESPPKRIVEEDGSSDVVDESPPKKKGKPSVDRDAEFAARLQAEEAKLARPTRGSNTRKKVIVKKKSSPKKKTAARAKAEEDSDPDDSEAGEQKPVRNTGFHKPLILSPALSALFGGETMLSRPQSVKRLWEHIRTNGLQDPTDKRQIRCDDAMRAVFKQDKVHMFQMTKILNQNLYNPDE